MTRKATMGKGRGCHLKRGTDCFSWEPDEKTVEQMGLTPHDMEIFGLRPGQRLLWCGGCESVYYLVGNNHARIVGHATNAGVFRPGDPKESQWLG